MKTARRVQIVGAAAALVMFGYVGGAAAGSGSSTPTRDEALAALAHAQNDLDVARQYIQAQPTGVPSTAPTQTAVPTTTPTGTPAQQHTSGMPWSSGVFAMHSGSNATAFGNWRNGRRIDNVVVAPTRDNWDEMLNPWWQDSLPDGFNARTDDLVVGVPLWPEDGNVSSNYDSQWATLADQIKATDSNAYVRLGWEMNIDQHWKVTAGNRTAWIAAFNRAAAVFDSHCPDCRIVFNPNRGADQTDTDSRSVFQAVKSKVDVYAIDSYDESPPDKSSSDWNTILNGSRNLQDSYDYAIANGKQFALPEWGLGCTGSSECQWNGSAGGDNPRYINDYMDWFNSIRSGLAFESYFNEEEKYIKSNLYPTGTNPNAAAAYRNKIAQYDSL